MMQQSPRNRQQGRAAQRKARKNVHAQIVDKGTKLKMLGKSTPNINKKRRWSIVFKWAVIVGVVLIVVVILVMTANWLSLIALVAGVGLGVYIGRSTKK